MKELSYKIIIVIGTMGIYYVFGLNAVKLLLLFIPEFFGLSQSIRNNQTVVIIIAGILAPIIAAGLTYKILAKYRIKSKSEDKKMGEEMDKIMKVTLIIVTVLTSFVTILSAGSSNK